jgi:DNA-binding response OmpR family regulator
MAARRLRVLAVESDAMIALELRDMLEDLGHEVLGPVARIDAALALLREAGPDAAIVDANLEDTLASPIVDALRETGTPFALATGYTTSELASIGLGGILIGKPYSPEDLARALGEMRERCRPAGGD